jgi:REP element-mobilizing transposase RayT
MRVQFRALRSQFVFPTVRGVIADSNARRGGDFRVVHFSVQGDHLHLIVEAEDRERLLRGMRGLAVSLARRVNRLVFRRGRLFADRWHGRALSSPRAVRHAIVYVLGNFKKHTRVTGVALDACSSAPYFSGFAEYGGRAPVDLGFRGSGDHYPAMGAPVAAPRTWLLRSGWTRHGLISIAEAPRRDR